MCVLLYINIQYISVCTPSGTHRQPGETGESPAASPVVYPPPVELSRDPPGRSSVASTLWHSAAGLPGGPGDHFGYRKVARERNGTGWFMLILHSWHIQIQTLGPSFACTVQSNMSNIAIPSYHIWPRNLNHSTSPIFFSQWFTIMNLWTIISGQDIYSCGNLSL